MQNKKKRLFVENISIVMMIVVACALLIVETIERG
jgi:hypothetical protein